MRPPLVLACILIAGSSLLALADDAGTRIGAAAYGDWRSDAPGVRRKLTEADMPAPGATRSAANPSWAVARPEGAWPKAPKGFAVSLFASGLKEPRVVRVAPNGDVFVAESAAGRVTVLSAADGAAKAATSAVFADGLHRPFGIAFYPTRPDPRYVYVAETDRVVRFPYRSGETKTAGPAEVVVPSLPSGRGHWTRDLAFSADGKTLFVSVGSGSNDADAMPDAPTEGLAAFVAKHALGAAWGAEENRADVLAFDPDGGGRRVFATGLRNCSGLAVQPQTAALWCAVNERDSLGDDLPPDYATSVKPGAFYGWPWFYIGDHEDPRLKGRRADLAASVTVPDVLIQAHSAPLGIAFYDGAQLPAASAATPSSRCTARGTAPSAPATKSCGCRSRTARRPANTRISSPASSPTTPACGGGRSTSPSRTTARCWSPTTPAARSGASPIRSAERRRRACQTSTNHNARPPPATTEAAASRAARRQPLMRKLRKVKR